VHGYFTAIQQTAALDLGDPVKSREENPMNAYKQHRHRPSRRSARRRRRCLDYGLRLLAQKQAIVSRLAAIEELAGTGQR